MSTGTNRRVLSAEDELCIQKIVKDAHKEQFENCGNVFVKKEPINTGLLVTIISGVLVIAGSLVAWGMSIQSSVAVLTATADKHNSDLIAKKSKDVTERDSIIKENSEAFKELLKSVQEIKRLRK
jgi:uncharacterized protein (DUF3084 family)